MSKLRINPSLLKLSARCDYAAALKLIPDPRRGKGKGHAAYYGEGTRNRMAAGIYFEVMCTGKDYSPRADSDGKYERWLSGASPDTLLRIEHYASFVRNTYLVPTPYPRS